MPRTRVASCQRFAISLRLIWRTNFDIRFNYFIVDIFINEHFFDLDRFCGCGSGDAGCRSCGVCRTCARVPNDDGGIELLPPSLVPAPPQLHLPGGVLMLRPVNLHDMGNFQRIIPAGRELDDPKIRDVIRVEALLGSGKSVLSTIPFKMITIHWQIKIRMKWIQFYRINKTGKTSHNSIKFIKRRQKSSKRIKSSKWIQIYEEQSQMCSSWNEFLIQTNQN